MKAFRSASCSRRFTMKIFRFAMCSLFLAGLLCVSILPASADIPTYLGAAADYGILFTGQGGRSLTIGNALIDGVVEGTKGKIIGNNIGIGGNGVFRFTGNGYAGIAGLNGKLSSYSSGEIDGNLDYSAMIGQYQNSNPDNIGPNSVHTGVYAVTTALNTVSNLSNNLGNLAKYGYNIALNGTQTVDASKGTKEWVNGTLFEIFNVSNYSSGDGKMLTINGDTKNPKAVVVFDFGMNRNLNLMGDITLGNGLKSDQVLWNFTGSGKTVTLNTDYSQQKNKDPNLSWKGILLAPKDGITLTNANLEDGRIFGGGAVGMTITNGSHVMVPAPAAILLFGPGLAGLALIRRKL